MHKTYLYLTLIALWCTLPLHSGKLTVVIAVDGLDHAALSQMQPFWPQGGLRTLSEEAYQTTVTYPHWLYGGDEALATLLTGTTPSMHGVGSTQAFSRNSRKAEDIFVTSKKMAIGTSTAYWAAPLLATTASDQLRLREGSDAQIYAIGLTPDATILLAGHAANACCWLGLGARTDSLQWVSTSYYREGLPAAADRMNIDGSLTHLLNREWTPRMEPATYLHPTNEEKKHGFKYQLTDSSVTRFPYSNTAVIELALALQKEQRLGQALTTDALMLQLSVLTPNAQQAAIGSAEQEDMYLSLNQDLGYLIEQLEKRLPREALQIVVMGIPRMGVNTALMEEYNMPLQTLSIDRVVALTSTYLMALYGHERWIDGGYGHSLYLNRMLIEQKHLSLETIRRQVAEFLMEFDGVRFACPASEAYLYAEMAPSLHKRFVGDVVFTLQSNYTLTNPSTPNSPSLPDAYCLSPVLIWYGDHRPFPSSLPDATSVARYLFP